MIKPISPAPVHWKRIEIRRFQIFEHLKLERTVARTDRGQWTLLIGENGAGKTSFLKSLALAMMSIFDRGAVSPATNSSPSIQVDFSNGVRLAVTPAKPMRTAGGGTQSPDFREPWWAYSSQRGTTAGGPARSVDFNPRLFARSMFDPDWRVINAETWLKNLKLAALQEGRRAEALLDSVIRTLIEILPEVEEIEIRSDGVFLKRTSEKAIPLQSWSDGYLSTAGWILDLMARWIERAKEKGIPIEGDFRDQMTGVVLIDEIDLHLHPAWQTQIVSDLRRLFPRLSFVATTHNPLTLLGAEPGEVYVMRRNPEGQIDMRARDIPPGLDVDQILTGDWFGLSSTLDRDTLNLLDRHREMVREGKTPEDPERRSLESELRRRLGTFGETSVDRIVQSVAADLMPAKPEELGSDARSKLRAKILSTARRQLG